jgi:hypothetical protein
MSKKSVTVYSTRLYRFGVYIDLTWLQSGIDSEFQLDESTDTSHCIKLLT